MAVPEDLVGLQKCMSPSQHTRHHKAQPPSKNHRSLLQTGYAPPPRQVTISYSTGGMVTEVHHVYATLDQT
eukprot:12729027-Ditylum_brightwellii.AAC.1